MKSIAIVGSAPSIFDYPNGPLVDSHEMVVRFNRAITAGHEHQVGSRTDVLFAAPGNSLELSGPPAATLRPRAVVCLVSPGFLRTNDGHDLESWLQGVPVMFCFPPDLGSFAVSYRTRPLTTGTYALFTLLAMFAPERLFLTGFTLYGAVPGGSQNYYHRSPVGVYHDFAAEEQIFTALARGFGGALTVTPEVGELLRRNGLHLPGNAQQGQRAPSVKLSFRQRLERRVAAVLLDAGQSLRRAAESRRR